MKIVSMEAFPEHLVVLVTPYGSFIFILDSVVHCACVVYLQSVDILISFFRPSLKQVGPVSDESAKLLLVVLNVGSCQCGQNSREPVAAKDSHKRGLDIIGKEDPVTVTFLAVVAERLYLRVDVIL